MKKDVFNYWITKNQIKSDKFDMPFVKAFNIEDLSCEFLQLQPFNFALTESDPQSKICHFYLDDYQFERVWREPETYCNILKNFNAVIGPDFSMFSNLPLPQQMYNNWRNKVLMSYWQSKNIKVIPNIQWSDNKSFDYCFEGIETNSVIAVSSTGCHSKEAKSAFLKGYFEMLEVLKPSKILLIGNLPNELSHETKIIQINSFMEERRKIWAEEAALLKATQ